MKRILNISAFCTGGVLLLVLLLPSCATTQLHAVPPVQQYTGTVAAKQEPPQRDRERADLKVMTLNVAHGRGTSFHQLLQQSNETVKNLDSISSLLRSKEPDVIALQEIDAPSFWSGNFNHLDYLASNSLFTHSVQALHVDALGLAYGTALMSRLDLVNPQAVTFDPALSPMPKGFVVSTIRWPGENGIAVDVVSVHLDFMSGEVRRKQADELIALLRNRNNRVILMGDLNDGWLEQGSTAQYLAKALDLTAFQPENGALVTFPALGERLDWILVSPGLRFVSHEVIGTEVSDHRGVLARLALAESG